jgi:hypothetical protein
MRDRDRERVLSSFADLYFPEEAADMIRRMPTERVDPEGTLFDEYFGMIQTVTNAPQDKSLSPQEKEVLEAKMRLIAHKYGYPKTVIINIEGNNAEVS